MAEKDRYNFKIQQEINDGAGRVVFAMRRPFYERLLAYAGVTTAAELPEDLVRELCERAIAPSSEPENIVEIRSVLVHEDESGRRSEFHSDDLGVDMVRRMMPIGQEEFALRCNPQYSSVVFELRVMDASDQQPAEDVLDSIGCCVLQTMLHPPSLA
jgi:hypothetical protein